MNFLKKIIKKTPLYGLLKRQRTIESVVLDTHIDDKALAFYSEFVNRGSLCFDVGANVGNRVAIFLKLGAQVIAVEPQNQCAKILYEKFDNNSQLTIIQAALGENEGEAEMMISDADTISSLSPQWVDAVKKSGRFASQKWDGRQRVHLMTLDSLINRYGIPDFIKIDVEGFEYEVLKGLTRPVKVLSFEFVPEVLLVAENSIEHLSRLGKISLNMSLGESMQLHLDKWVSSVEMLSMLQQYKDKTECFGDIYVRFAENKSR